MVIKIKYILLVVGLGIVGGVGIFALYAGFDYDNLYENVNIWYKVSSDGLNPGEVIALDMSSGYSECDGSDIYILVYDIDSMAHILVFPNRGNWWVDRPDTVSMEIQKVFGKLEQDLKTR